MTPEEAIELLKGMQSPLEDYAELVGAPAFAYGHKYAYPYPQDYAIEEAIEALKEIQLYKDNKLCLVPEDVYSRQCSELDAYKEIGTVEECREAVANKKKCEKQWHNDMENPLEPIKVYSALKSEILKLELRIKNRPKDISILDYTIIAALQKVLKNNLEGMEDE